MLSRMRTVWLGAAMLVACSSVPLSDGGRRVRMIEPDQTDACRFIANDQLSDSASGTSPGVCAQRADAAMKNRVAELGGNAYVITYRLVRPCLAGGTTLIFDAYHCPEN